MKPFLLNEETVSLPRLVLSREAGILPSNSFENHFIQKQTAHMTLLTQRPVISTQLSPTPLTTMDLSSNNQRFLLTANESGGIFLYDLSKWGLDDKPVMPQQSFASSRLHQTPSILPSTHHSTSTSIFSPIGHAQQGKSPIRRAQWHGQDSLAFCTASADGRVVVWDAAGLEAVLTLTPFLRHTVAPPNSNARRSPASLQASQQQQQQWPISSMDKNTFHPDQLVVASAHDSSVKLLDLRSATCSHSLLGHSRGCNVAKWSPHSPYCIVSGDGDGNLYVWDVRRANACLTVLQRQQQQLHDGYGASAGNRSRAIRPHYGHLKQRACSNKKRKSPTTTTHPSQSSLAAAPTHHHASHAGAIEQLAFDAHGQYLVSLSNKTLTLWDMLDRTPFVPRHYATLSSSSTQTQRPLVITPNGKSDYIIWIGDRRVAKGYSLLNGGSPVHSLKGHLGNVTDIVSHDAGLMSTARDQVILQWGQEETSRKRMEMAAVVDRDNW